MFFWRNTEKRATGFPAALARDAFLEQFQFETLRVANHTSCRFAEKRGFSAHFGPGGAVPPPRVFTFFKGETLYGGSIRSRSSRSPLP